ncbi:MAG: C25 family cysteine peptidase [candidate division WOR-3 bacterium]
MIEKGIWATIVTPEMIYQTGIAGRDNAEKIRNWLIYGWQHCGLTWLLLGGDDKQVPIRYGYAINNYPDEWSEWVMPADLYFSDLTGEWDLDNDGRWGEPTDDQPDVYPEIFAGRIPCRTPEEVQNWVYKELFYEKTGSQDLSLLPKDLWIYAHEFNPHNYQVPEQFPRPPYLDVPYELADEDAWVCLCVC